MDHTYELSRVLLKFRDSVEFRVLENRRQWDSVHTEKVTFLKQSLCFYHLMLDSSVMLSLKCSPTAFQVRMMFRLEVAKIKYFQGSQRS